MRATTVFKAKRIGLLAAAAFLCGSAGVQATSPEQMAEGRRLFEREWSARNPTFGSDGLGPLFNGKSCVACHHQGGVGGAGDARFNARSVGIVQMNVEPRPSSSVFANLVSSFHPSFVASGNTVISSMPLPHHGGSAAFESKRAGLMQRLPALTDPAGGPKNAEEVRLEIAVPIDYQQTLGGHHIDLQAMIFHRNTTPLFGLSLIDAVPVKAIEQQARRQQRHSEISGRPATLRNGGVGKFGWRANVATLRQFNDQACANELGLETPTSDQPADATAPGYRNPGRDLDRRQVEAMHQFVAALPAPVRAPPESPEQAHQVKLGEQAFAAVGCAVCHTPSLGPAEGLYSDLLLHDMGPELGDPSAADPKIVRSKLVSRSGMELTGTVAEKSKGTDHYGDAAPIELTEDSGSRRNNISMQPSGSRPQAPMPPSGSRPGIPTQPTGGPVRLISGASTSSGAMNPGYYGSASVVSPSKPVTSIRAPVPNYQFVPLGSIDEYESRREQRTSPSGRKQQVRRVTKTRHDLFVRHTTEPTRVTQEWRTAPLWGLHDSPPYMHDGRAGTVLEAIVLHGGESSGTRDRFLNLPFEQREAVLAFLDTLVAPPNALQRSQ